MRWPVNTIPDYQLGLVKRFAFLPVRVGGIKLWWEWYYEEARWLERHNRWYTNTKIYHTVEEVENGTT